MLCIILYVLLMSCLLNKTLVLLTQCANSPDYFEPTQEPCVCPPGAPGLPGTKVSYSNYFFLLSFLFLLIEKQCHE